MTSDKQNNARVKRLIVFIGIFIGLIFVGMYFDWISSVISMVLAAVIIGYFEKIERNSKRKWLTMMLFIALFVGPLCAFIDLRGNKVYNLPVQYVYCTASDQFQTDVRETQSFGTKKAINFSFACSCDTNKWKEISSFKVYAIRWLEYVLIGLLLFVFFSVLSLFRGKKAVV